MLTLAFSALHTLAPFDFLHEPFPPLSQSD